MKLSTAIRRGYKMYPELKQARGLWFESENGEVIAMCPLSAAYLVAHPDKTPAEAAAETYTIGSVTHWSKRFGRTQDLVLNWNDTLKYQYTAGQIAYKLERDPDIENPEVS